MYGPRKFASLFPSNMGFGFLNEGQKPSFWCIIGVFGQIWPQQNKTKRTRTPENVRYKEAFGGIQVINCQGMVVSCCLHKNSCPDDTMPLNILNKTENIAVDALALNFPFPSAHGILKKSQKTCLQSQTIHTFWSRHLHKDIRPLKYSKKWVLNHSQPAPHPPRKKTINSWWLSTHSGKTMLVKLNHLPNFPGKKSQTSTYHPRNIKKT